jgi:hypothetical protein
VKYQKIWEAQESDEDDTTEHERVTNQDARKFIAGLRLYLCRKAMKTVLYLRWFCSAAVNQEKPARYTRSVPPSLFGNICMFNT